MDFKKEEIISLIEHRIEKMYDLKNYSMKIINKLIRIFKVELVHVGQMTVLKNIIRSQEDYNRSLEKRIQCLNQAIKDKSEKINQLKGIK